MSSTAPCRFYALGSCSKGKKCTFSHEKSQPVCQFYLQGTCKFGLACALKHKKLKNTPIVPVHHSQTDSTLKKDIVFKVIPTYSDTQPLKKSLSPLCPFSNSCKFGTKCKYIHAEQCPKCLEYCLHPDESHNEHIATCVALEKNVSIDQSKLECTICMEIPKCILELSNV
jgi:hypothetical protein